MGRSRIGPAAGPIAAILTLCLSASPAPALEPSGLLEIHYINVQQGGATLVIGPDGTTVLLDAGSGGKGIGEVVPYLMSIGLAPADGLDFTLASHLDSDHVGGFDEVFAAGYDVRERNWFNGSAKTNATVEAYRAAASLTQAGLPQPIAVGETVDLGSGARLTAVAVAGEILGGANVPGAAANENDLSVAVLVELGDFDFLWAGDLGGGDADSACTGRTTGQADVETPLALALTPGGAAPRLSAEGVDVLHVNHHGSESSTNSEWMNLLRPEVAVISVGAGQGGNFHHPRRDVVEGVLLKGAPCVTAPAARLVLQTEEGSPIGASTSFAGHAVGDVRITTDGATYRVEATGAVSQGPDERSAAGLPRVFPVDEAGACSAGPTTLCLLGGRFRVSVDWERPNGQSGQGQAVPFTDRAGLFYFFNEDNLEMLVKMQDACTFNQHFWVFFAATTNVELTLRVTDTETGLFNLYSNPQGMAALPVQDTRAFATCEGGNAPPEAGFAWSCRGFHCTFTDESDDPDGSIENWSWSFGDGATSGVPSPRHVYGVAGDYRTRLTVTDDGGAQATAESDLPVRCIIASQCCRVCNAGQACGDSCIAPNLTCHQPPGCACDGEEVCP